MNLKTKKQCTYAVIVLYNLSIGIGYAIIFPTIWNYVHKRFGGDETMLGIIISSYSISSFFANIFIGWLSDKTQRTKTILLVTILAEIIGSFMYFVGISNYFLILSRLISGLGGGGGAVIIADISKTTTEKERTSVLAIVVSSRQLGFLVGPALTIFLSKFDFHIGDFPVDKFTSPGLFMSFLWIVICILVIFLFYNLVQLKDEEDVEQLFPGYIKNQSIPYAQGEYENSMSEVFVSSYPSYIPPTSGLSSLQHNTLSMSVPNLQTDDVQRYVNQTNEFKNITCQKLYGAFDEPNLVSCQLHREISEYSSGGATDNMIETAERVIQSVSELNQHFCDEENVESIENQPVTDWVSNHSSDGNHSECPSPVPTSERRFSFRDMVSRGFLRDEVVVLMGLSFISCFAQTVLETVVTPLAQKFYEFTEMQNSLLYLFSGIEVIIIYIVLRYVSQRITDRWLLLFGIVILCVATSIPLVFVPVAEAGGYTFPYFVITVVLDLIGIAVIVVCSASLLSKVVDQEKQGLAQGIRRSMVSVGCILGPLWGGGYLNHLYILFAVPLILSLFIAILLILSFKRLNTEDQQD